VPRFGFLARHIYTLRIPPGACPHLNPALTGCDNAGDTLPVGTVPILYMFSVFDTGSTVVLINNINRANGTSSDAQALALCRPNEPCQLPADPRQHDPFLPTLLDARVWGLAAVEPVSTNAPLGMPQFEATSVQVRPYRTRETLIGAPLAARAVAVIDYGVTVSRSFDVTPPPGRETTIEAPDIRFFRTGDPMIPNAPFVFSLTQTGMFGVAADGASTGPRFLIPGASFVLNGRTASGSTFSILYDTGNQTTQVTERVAQALGIQLGTTPAVDRITIGTLDAGDIQMQGFALDRFELVTRDGASRFRVNRPMVYVRPNRADGSNPFPNNIDAVFGSNYLWERRVIFNGPASTLGMFDISPINP
jgi:hypothetical protein